MLKKNYINMPYVNTHLASHIPEHLEEVMPYYPDVLLFELNQRQYSHLWRELSSAKYIYTNGYEIKPTSWFMHALQTLKGWLGFRNNCHPEKISYSLNKLAYYGYSKQFSQPNFPAILNYPMPSEFYTLASHEYNISITAQLQEKLLMDYFKVEHSLNFDYPYQHLEANHRFGDSWAKEREFELIPQVDPQDDSLIQEVIHALEQEKVSVKKLHFLKHSKYAKTAAQYFSDKAKNTVAPNFLTRLMWTDPRPNYLATALAYDPEIAKRDSQKFIEHYLKHNDHQSAFNLLNILNDSKLILKFLLKIPETERKTLIQKDTPLAAILANHHIEKKQYILAQQIYSNIEELNPAVAFVLEIQAKCYVGAYEIFKRQASSGITFPPQERTALALVFAKQAETEYQTGKIHRTTKKWQKAEQHYLQSLEHKEAAYHLNPTMKYLEEVYTHKRLYALVLIDADLDLYQPEDSNHVSIEKAITLLRECQSSHLEEQFYQKQALATALMRRVDTLREEVAVTHANNHYATPTHKIQHQKKISEFIKTLNEMITLLKGTKNNSLREKLGKAHYLLADVQLYFDRNAPDINQHYKMAMEAVPQNPFYLLRVAEIFEDREDIEDIRNSGIILLKEMGYLVPDYVHWSEERWLKKDNIIYNIKDIHQPPMCSDTQPACPLKR